MSDPYFKLRPDQPTPPSEICSCPGEPPILLFRTFGPNPLHCIVCNLEVPPDRLGFSEQLASDIASWRSFYGAFDTLWLDSGEFEAWAVRHLTDPTGAVVTKGRAVVADLNKFRRTYLLWFQDASAEDYAPPTSCPVCGMPLAPRGRARVCDACAIGMYE